MIRIKRDSGWADRARAYKIVIDDKVVGTIRNGQQVELEVTPGRHRLHLKIDWCRSNFVDFEAAGGTVEFECGSSLRGLKIFLSILYVTFLHSQYLWLRKLD